MIFEGFPKEANTFFKNLKNNNNKTWFQANKETYENSVKKPMLHFIMDMGEALVKFAPDFIADPRINGSMYRIYRDTRFSKSKIPYKTHVAAIFWHNEGSKHGSAGYYIHFDDIKFFIGGGIYMPESAGLSKIRRYITAHPDEFKKIITNRKFKSVFGEIQGESLLRPPRGFDPNHPMIDFLKMKQYLVSVDGKTSKLFQSREILDYTISTFITMTPFIAFLNKGLGLKISS